MRRRRRRASSLSHARRTRRVRLRCVSRAYAARLLAARRCLGRRRARREALTRGAALASPLPLPFARRRSLPPAETEEAETAFLNSLDAFLVTSFGAGLGVAQCARPLALLARTRAAGAESAARAR